MACRRRAVPFSEAPECYSEVAPLPPSGALESYRLANVCFPLVGLPLWVDSTQ
jgi:hypothetical protein